MPAGRLEVSGRGDPGARAYRNSLDRRLPTGPSPGGAAATKRQTASVRRGVQRRLVSIVRMMVVIIGVVVLVIVVPVMGHRVADGRSADPPTIAPTGPPTTAPPTAPATPPVTAPAWSASAAVEEAQISVAVAAPSIHRVIETSIGLSRSADIFRRTPSGPVQPAGGGKVPDRSRGSPAGP